MVEREAGRAFPNQRDKFLEERLAESRQQTGREG